MVNNECSTSRNKNVKNNDDSKNVVNINIIPDKNDMQKKLFKKSIKINNTKKEENSFFNE